jgi:pSer/pThr/pTyr-binding forkhead associated (FHA) protein
MKFTLKDNQTKKVYTLKEGQRAMIGRQDGLDITIEEPRKPRRIWGLFTVGERRWERSVGPYSAVSRAHAEVRLASGMLGVTDLESKNGTFFIPKGREESYRIRAGDEIFLSPGDTLALGRAEDTPPYTLTFNATK